MDLHLCGTEHERDPRRDGRLRAESSTRWSRTWWPDLDQFDVSKGDQDELLGVLGPMKSYIVEIDSPETGMPLPDSYQPAPALG